MHYVEVSVAQPVHKFAETVKQQHGQRLSVKLLMTDPKWKTATVRLSSNDREDVEQALSSYFPSDIARMHCAAIKIGV